MLLAWRNVQRNRRRSFFTLLIAALGTTAILIASGFALYTYDILKDGAAREYGHLTIATPDYFSRDEDAPMQFGMEDGPRLAEHLAARPDVVSILPRISFSGLISNGDKSVIFLGTGANLVEEVAARGIYLEVREGALPREPGQGSPKVLLGTDLARSLGAKPGSGLTLLATTAETGSINAIDVEVAAIVSTGWSDLDKRLVYTELGAAQHLLMTRKISTLSVYLKDLEGVAGLMADLTATAPGHALKPWWEQAFYYHSVRELYNRIFGLLGLIIAALVMFSVTNTLAMAVVERTREIGTLRALGAHPQEIVAQFLREGFLIGTVGVLIGDLVAGLIIVLLPYAGIQMPPPPGRSVGYPLLVLASGPLFLLTNLVIVVLCAGAAWFASHKAARKPIVEALGHV